MTEKEIVSALRATESRSKRELLDAAADLIEKLTDRCTEEIAVAQERTRWIPVSERLPKPETEVMVVCNRNGRQFIATAIHEDGTLFVEDSDWNWNDIWEYGRYDEERDDYIIPEGWWESRCFTPDDVYNCPVDCEVTLWRPMLDPPKEER